jgi:hypothetical protein
MRLRWIGRSGGVWQILRMPEFRSSGQFEKYLLDLCATGFDKSLAEPRILKPHFSGTRVEAALSYRSLWAGRVTPDPPSV